MARPRSPSIEQLIDAASRAALTPWPADACVVCGHAQGDHRSTARGSFNLNPVRYGACIMPGCECRGYARRMSEQTPVPTQPEQPDQPEPQPEADPTAPEPEQPQPEQPARKPGQPDEPDE